jgi:tripartite ATP-independent transporter DctP family solute receptor
MDTPDNSMFSRRRFLKGTALGIGVSLTPGLLAACGSSNAKNSAASGASSSAPVSSAPTSGASAAASAASKAGSGQVKKYRLATVNPVTDPWVQAAQKFADLVNSRTNGAVQIVVYPNSQLGAEKVFEESVGLGAVDFAIGSPGVLTNFDPKIGLFDLPYLFKSYKQSNAVMNGPVGDSVFESLRGKAGIRVLASGAQGLRDVVTGKKVINSLKDLRGLTIRIPDAVTYVNCFKDLGAQPNTMAFSQVYTSLRTGVIDGAEGVPSIFENSKFYETAKHIAVTNHILATLQLIVSDKVFQKMDADTQKIVTEAAKEAWADADAQAQSGNESDLTKLQSQGMTITKPDLAPFIAAVSPYVDQWAGQNGAKDLIDQVRNTPA